jgi:hypothetical protein
MHKFGIFPSVGPKRWDVKGGRGVLDHARVDVELWTYVRGVHINFIRIILCYHVFEVDIK